MPKLNFSVKLEDDPNLVIYKAQCEQEGSCKMLTPKNAKNVTHEIKSYFYKLPEEEEVADVLKDKVLQKIHKALCFTGLLRNYTKERVVSVELLKGKPERLDVVLEWVNL